MRCLGKHLPHPSTTFPHGDRGADFSRGSTFVAPSNLQNSQATSAACYFQDEAPGTDLRMFGGWKE